MPKQQTSRQKVWRTFTGRVFVFGAGVSAACGIPVAKDILRSAIADIPQNRSGQVNEVHKLLKYLYPSFKKELANYPNIEDFLNFLEMAERFNTDEYSGSSVWPKSRLSAVRGFTLKAVTDHLWRLMQLRGNFHLLREYVASEIKTGDVIITFNWDTTVEHAMHMHPREPAFDYSYPPGESDDVENVLLKPHGSIDWFHIKDLPKRHAKGDFEALDAYLRVFTRFDFRDHPSLFARTPIIVPPVSSKDFDYHFLKETWNSVHRAVSQATEINILGYSLPQEDQFARFVLRRAIRTNRLNAGRRGTDTLRVKILNPDSSILVNFTRLVGTSEEELSSISFTNAYFQDFVNARAGKPIPTS